MTTYANPYVEVPNWLADELPAGADPLRVRWWEVSNTDNRCTIAICHVDREGRERSDCWEQDADGIWESDHEHDREVNGL